MISDYVKWIQKWCKLKILLWGKQSKVIFKQGDIWWCSLGVNIGEEMYGKGDKFTRPVLIFRKFTSNSFLGLPITKQADYFMNLIYLFIFIIGIVAGGALVGGFAVKRKRGGSTVDKQIEEKIRNKQKIRELLQRRERITNDDIENMLGVSNATTARYLDELEGEGLIKQVGRTGRSVYYERL